MRSSFYFTATLILALMLLLPSISALEFDNVKEYDSTTKTATIVNSFGLGSPIADVKLKSELNLQVGLGYQKVFEYEINSYQDYSNFIQELEIYNIKNGMKRETKKIDLKYLGLVDVEVNDYKEVCIENIKNGSKDCYSELVGSHTEQKEDWINMDKLGVKQEKITISGWTEVSQGDYYEWIPNFAGIRVPEWATWTGNMSVNLISYYKLNETTGTSVVDSLGNNNLINSGADINQPGKIGSAYKFGLNDILNGSSTDFANEELSINMWANITGAETGDILTQLSQKVSFNRAITISFVTPTTLGITSYNGTSLANASSYSPYFNNWTMVTATRTKTALKLYFNGVSVLNQTVYFPMFTDIDWLTIGTNPESLSSNINGSLDEIAIYNKTLTQAEILVLFNSGIGCQYGDEDCYTTIPVVTLNSPLNNSIITTSNPNLNATAFASAGYLMNMSLCSNISGTWSCGDTTNLNPTYATEETGKSLNANNIDASYVGYQIYTKYPIVIRNVTYNNAGTVTCKIRDSSNNELDSATGSGNVAVFDYQSTNATLYRVVCSGTSYDYRSEAMVNISKTYITYNNSILGLNVDNGAHRGVLSIGVSTGFQNTNYTNIFTKAVSSGGYKWNVQACNSIGNCSYAPSNYTFYLDATVPTITINSGNGTQNYGSLSANHTINLTVTDTNIDKVWLNYNGTNRTITLVSGVMNSTSFALVQNLYNATIYANDTAGNVGSQVVSWDYLLLQSNTSYNPTALETSSQTFIFVGEKATAVTSISARMFYNGTERTSTIISSGNNVNITNTFEIPQGSGSRNFFWEVTMVTSTGTIIVNTTTQTQTVSNITFNICTVPTGLALNFTTYDTSTNLPLDSAFEATFSYYAAGGSGEVLAEYNYQNLTENRSNYLFCLNSTGLNVTLDAFISYSKIGYDRREYIINEGTIGNFTVAIPLFLTQTTLTDVVTFTLEDQNYDPIPGAIVTVQRWNVGTNTYSTIGVFETTSAGQGIMDLELYNTWYRVTVTLDGQIIYTSGVQKIASTEWNILINLEVQNPYDLFGTISKGLTYDNATQIVTYTWSDSSGYTNNGCLVVNKLTPSGYTTIYSACSETVAGSINYQLVQNGTYEIYGIIYLTAEYDGISQISDVLYVQIGEDELTTTVAPYGKVISLLAVGTAGFIGISAGSPILGAVLLILSLVGVSLAGWLGGISAIIWGLITVLIIILARQARRGG